MTKKRPLLRLLLYLYPARFRYAYGDEALRLLSRDLDRAGALGPVDSLAARVRHLIDFVAQGALERVSELRRATRTAHAFEGVVLDVRLAFRSAVKRPGFLLVAVTSLAVGVGANAAMFSVIDSLFLRPIPGVDEPDRLVDLGLTRRGAGFGGWDYPDFLDVRDQAAPLEYAAMYQMDPVSLSDETGGELLPALYVTSGYFEAMGALPTLGRSFVPEEDTGPGEHAVVVVSHREWRDRFGSDPDILGRTLRLNRETYTVIGVAPNGFQGHLFGLKPSVYVPLTQHQPARNGAELFFGSRGTMWGNVVGRLRPGATLEQLDAALGTVLARLEDEYPETNHERGARALRSGLIPSEARTQIAVVFAFVVGLMVLVLAATCANVGGMILARASSREREMAVRLALGSGRARLVRHLVAESMLLFALGGIGGVLLAIRGIGLIDPNRFLPVPFPVAFELAVDWRILAFGMALTVVTGLVFGLLPALQATRSDPVTSLRDGSAGSGLRASRLRRVFVSGQVGVSILLLASAGLFLRSLQEGADIEIGFEPEGVYVTSFDLSMEGYRRAEQASALADRLLDQLRSMPGVSGATIATDLPLDGGTSSTPVWTDGRERNPDVRTQTYYARVTTQYFETLGIEVLRGRTFGPEDDRRSERVAIMNQLLAERAWPGQDPLGRVVEFGLDPVAYTVVGVVADTRTDMISDDPAPQIFSVLAQDYGADVHVAVRATTPTPDFVSEINRAIRSVDPAIALSPTRSLAALSGLGMLPHRIAAGAASLLGLLALLLSSIGVYGVVAFAVTQRTREIGVRIALGASRGRVLARVLASGMGLALPGLVVGLALAAGLGHLLRAFLLGVSPLDPAAYAAVAGLLMLVVACASLAPARRASAVEPVRALRSD